MGGNVVCQRRKYPQTRGVRELSPRPPEESHPLKQPLLFLISHLVVVLMLLLVMVMMVVVVSMPVLRHLAADLAQALTPAERSQIDVFAAASATAAAVAVVVTVAHAAAGLPPPRFPADVWQRHDFVVELCHLAVCARPPRRRRPRLVVRDGRRAESDELAPLPHGPAAPQPDRPAEIDRLGIGRLRRRRRVLLRQLARHEHHLPPPERGGRLVLGRLPPRSLLSPHEDDGLVEGPYRQLQRGLDGQEPEAQREACRRPDQSHGGVQQVCSEAASLDNTHDVDALCSGGRLGRD